jgi:hypothetical protein
MGAYLVLVFWAFLIWIWKHQHSFMPKQSEVVEDLDDRPGTEADPDFWSNPQVWDWRH